jgi:hypothetical protein
VNLPVEDEGVRASVDTGPAADTARLRIRSAARAPLGALLLAISVLWLWAGVRAIVTGETAIMPGLGAGGAYLVGALGVALTLLALDWIVRGRTVVIGHHTVAVTDRSLRGRRVWREPLANYTELRVYRELRTHRAGLRSWYVVRLCHPEAAKAIELARAKEPALIERRAREWAGRLGLTLSWQQFETNTAVTGRGERRSEVAAPTMTGKQLATGRSAQPEVATR